MGMFMRHLSLAANDLKHVQSHLHQLQCFVHSDDHSHRDREESWKRPQHLSRVREAGGKGDILLQPSAVPNLHCLIQAGRGEEGFVVGNGKLCHAPPAIPHSRFCESLLRQPKLSQAAGGARLMQHQLTSALHESAALSAAESLCLCSCSPVLEACRMAQHVCSCRRRDITQTCDMKRSRVYRNLCVSCIQCAGDPQEKSPRQQPDCPPSKW